MHVEKVKLNAVYALLAHDFRYVNDGYEHEDVRHNDKTSDNRVVMIDGNSIVHESSGDNADLSDDLMRRCRRSVADARETHRKTAGRKPKSNTVGMVSTVVTLPYDWPEDQNPMLFFMVAYAALAEYNMKNGVDKKWLLPAAIHFDEATPHMHFLTIPIRKADEKDKDQDIRFDGSALVSKQYLLSLHPYVQAKVREKTGVDCHLLLDEKDEVKRALSHVPHDKLELVKNAIDVEYDEIDSLMMELGDKIASIDDVIADVERQKAIDDIQNGYADLQKRYETSRNRVADMFTI